MTDSLSEKNLAWRNTLKIEYKKKEKKIVKYSKISDFNL